MNGELFYIGKGIGNRMKRHCSIAKNNSKGCNRNPHLYNKIKKILSNGYTDINYEVFKDGITDELEAYALEAAVIECYHGQLCNIMPGGWAPSFQGRVLTQDTKDKIRAGVMKWDNDNRDRTDRIRFVNGCLGKNHKSFITYFESLYVRQQKQRAVMLKKDLQLLSRVIKDIKRELISKQCEHRLKEFQSLIDLNGCRTVQHAKNVCGISYTGLQSMVKRNEIKLYTGQVTELEKQYRESCRANLIGRCNRWKGKKTCGNPIF